MQISAFGGTMGLFTGVSLITFVEVAYWIFRFIAVTFFGAAAVEDSNSKRNSATNKAFVDSNRKVMIGGSNMAIQPVFGSNGLVGYS